MRRALLYVGGWFAAVVLATAVGFAAVGLVGGDVGGPAGGITVVADPITPTASATSTATPKHTKRAAPNSPDGDDTNSSTSSGQSSASATQVTEAGSVTAKCRSGARLVSWAPKNGWSVVDVVTVGTTREVVFGDGTNDVHVHVTCTVSGPVFDVTTSASEPSSSPTPTPSETDSIPSDKQHQ